MIALGKITVAAALCVAAFSSTAQAQQASQAGMRVTLLGTAGGPPPHLDRSQPASLLQIDGEAFLIDAGENAGQQLLRAGVPSPRLTATFISHLHWDHTLGLGYVMATGWMMGRSAPMPIWGPPGITDYVQRESAALSVGEDIFRAQAAARPALGSLYPVQQVDLTGPKEIFSDAKVKVTATPTSHFAVVHAAPHSYGEDKAYAYRFDSAKGSVTFTGDTGPSDAVTALAKGSDVLVAEIVDLDSIRAALVKTSAPGTNLDALMTHMREQHLTPEEVGKMASAAGVKKLVLTHFVMGQGADPASLADKIRPFFKGEIVVGKDLMTIEIGK